MKKNKKIIRSTKTTLKFSNKGKLQELNALIEEYKNVVSQFIDILWLEDEISLLLPKEITSKVTTWLSARMVQCAGKQASAIVRGTRTKQEKREFVLAKLIKEGKIKKARKLQKIIDEASISKPNIKSIEPELDSRFIEIDLENSTSFDGWITISSIGNKIKITLPFKKSKHFNKLLKKGKIKAGIRLSLYNITFNFDIEEISKKTKGIVLGIDVGQTTTISCSNNYISTKNKHGYDLSKITDILCRKTKGSNGFNKASQHRKNYINWTINQLNLKDIKEIKIEKIKDLRRFKRSSRKLSHWTYIDIFRKIKDKALSQGVLVTEINPTYTSKRCSVCGWTRTSNRKSKLFKCGQCGYSTDADLNAARNIAMPLEPIWFKNRQKYPIKTGFYWVISGQEPIVLDVQKTNHIFQYN